MYKKKKNRLAIGTYGTSGYLFAFKSMLRRVIASILAAGYNEGDFIFATDNSKEGEKAINFLNKEILSGWKVHIIKHDISDDSSQNYKEEAQKRIADLQGSVMHLARKLQTDLFWSVESDILVPPDALKISEWVLHMPDNYYDIVMITYPNGAFLGGRGSYLRPIEEDFLPHERKVPPRLMKIWDENQKRLNALNEELELHRKTTKVSKEIFQEKIQKLRKEHKRAARLSEKIKRHPPDGNIFEINGKYGWRPRGWLEHAYPAIGRGAILPTDWVGMGCTLLNKRALAIANFDGYGPDYSGTQDLYLTWTKWKPAGLRMCVVPHIVCDHIKCDLDKSKKRTGKINHFIAFHEPDGTHKGHLRIRVKSWND